MLQLMGILCNVPKFQHSKIAKVRCGENNMFYSMSLKISEGRINVIVFVVFHYL